MSQVSPLSDSQSPAVTVPAAPEPLGQSVPTGPPGQSGPPGPSGPSGTSGEFKSLDFFGMLLRGKWMIFFALATSLTLAYLKGKNDTPLFQSHAKLIVLRQQVALLKLDGLDLKNDYRHKLTTQMVLIRSARIVRPAVERHKLGQLSSYRSGTDPTEQIIAQLEVRNTAKDILELSVIGTNPHDCRVVLNAVVASYKEFLRQSYQSLGTETIDLITNARDQILSDLKTTEAAYRLFRSESPPIWRVDTNTNVHRDRLISIETGRAELALERTNLVAELQAIERAIKEGGDKEAIAIMVDKLVSANRNSGRNQSVDNQVWPLLFERQLLLEDVGLGHPKVKLLDRKIELIRGHVHKTQSGSTEQPRDFVTVYVDSLKQQLRAIQFKSDSFDEMFQKQKTEVAKFEELESRDGAFRNNILRLQRLFEAVVNRLGNVQLSRAQGGFQTEIVNAATLGIQIAPDMQRTLTGGLLLGLLAGMILAYIRERLDKRFLAPEDIHMQLGVPVVGHVPNLELPGHHRKSEPTDGPLPELVAFHRAKSRLAEAFRAIRVSLFFNSQATGHRVIQITSPNPGDGKSTLAANLAVSIAMSEKRVLLLDADLRRPRVHKILGLANDVGMVSVLCSDVELSDAVFASGIDNLDFMPAGPRPDNPAELLISREFTQLLEVLREKYDYIILDSPPLLAVTDASTIAARVDSVIMTIRLKSAARVVSSRAAEILGSVGASLFGIVVNGFGHASSYGYGKYGQYASYHYGGGHYAYGLQYGYGYGYHYDYNKAEDYTDNAPTTTPSKPAAALESASQAAAAPPQP